MKKFKGSHNEWDPLIEVVVGTTEGATRPRLGKDMRAIEYPDLTEAELEKVTGYSKHVLEETEEDLEDLVTFFRSLGVKVRRPAPVDCRAIHATPDWESEGFYNYCPRDSLLVIGDNLIEVPMTMRSRQYEAMAFRKMLLEYSSQGAKWFSAPKPQLLDETYNETGDGLALNNLEPIFDAANVLRAGKDLLYLVSNTGNELGAKWLQTMLGSDYRVHLCKDMYDGIHLDSTISLLRPGLVLLNPERVREDNLPEFLKSWDKIWCPTMTDTAYEGAYPMSSVWIGMNLVMVNPGLAIVDARQTELIKLLESQKIEVAPLTLRHCRTTGGGFHCVTLDTIRQGSLQDYR